MSKKQRKIVLLIAPLIVLLALFFVGRSKIQRVESEALQLAQTGRDAMNLLKEHVAGLQAGDLDRLAACYTEDFQDPDARGWTETLRSERDGVRVYDWQATDPLGNREGVRGHFGAMAARFDQVEMAKFKLDRVEEMGAENGRPIVRAFLWIRGEREGAAFESQALFRMGLERREGQLRIRSQELLHGTTVTGPRAGFNDVAESVGLDFQAALNPAFTTAEWEPKRFGILPYGSGGVSTADYDNDGWYDLFFADGADARLYRNEGGTFRDVTAEVGLPTGNHVSVALFADLDNDGDRDLVLGRFTAAPSLYRNDGGRFVDVTGSLGEHPPFITVATAGDYDEDGDLDLYLGRYLDPRDELPTTLFYTRNSEGNSLLRNEGDFRFTDVTEEAGVREGGLTLGVTFGDYDQDGDPDLYVANDFGRNALFRNEGDGTFTDVSEATGTLDFGYGMSADFGDPDNDGDLDLYISNVHSGQRWYGQATTLYQYVLNSTRQGTIVEDFPLYREIYSYAGDAWRHYGDRMVKGNSLLQNQGGERFTDVAEAGNANPFGWYWGSNFFDYDNDGREDIYSANGWITAASHDDL
jgi:hypothetical protein